MKLSELLSGIDVESSYEDVEISYITDSTEKCCPGCVFAAVKGRTYDGHSMLEEAEKNGAVYFLVQEDTGRKNQILVSDTEKAYALMCCNFFGNPSRRIKLIGVTGTNGKSTTVHIIHSLLTSVGKKAGLIGTVKNIAGGHEQDSDFTTPGSFDFNRLLREMVDRGDEYCVCEVSSQGLSQNRVYGCSFDTGVFTGFSPEHFDWHGDEENYYRAKRQLFYMCKRAVINIDCKQGERLKSETDIPCVTYSVKKDSADFTAKMIRCNEKSVDYAAVSYSLIGRVHFNSIGEFSVYNSLAAVCTLTFMGFDFDVITESMKAVPPLEGRQEILDTDTPFTVMTDYAHTPEALEKILSALCGIKKGRLITVFGCGGDRDKGKRPLMGSIACELSDITVVTTDNPRYEDREKIIKDILDGMTDRRKKIIVKADRRDAIETALRAARENDIVLIAGKGHEKYQTVCGERIPFDEGKIVAECLKTIKEQ